MTLTTQGANRTIMLNNEAMNEKDLTQPKDCNINPDGSEMPEWLQGKPWSKMPTKGRIGFQGRHAGAGIEFRRVKLLRL